MAGRKTLTLYAGMKGLSENAFINVKNQSHSITAELTVAKGATQGVILAQAWRFGGWSLYVKHGKPVYHYNWLGLERFSVTSSQALAPGTSTVRLSFTADGGAPGRGGIASLFVNDKKVGEGRIAKTQCCLFSLDEGTDVRLDEGTPVTEDYASPFVFTGTIRKVTVALTPSGTPATPAP